MQASSSPSCCMRSGTPPRHAARHFGGIRGKAETSSRAGCGGVADLDSKDVDTTRRRRRRLAERHHARQVGHSCRGLRIRIGGFCRQTLMGPARCGPARPQHLARRVNAIHARLHAMREVRPERADLFLSPGGRKKRSACTATRIDAYWQARRRNQLLAATGRCRSLRRSTVSSRRSFTVWQARDFGIRRRQSAYCNHPGSSSGGVATHAEEAAAKPFMCNPKVHGCPWCPTYPEWRQTTLQPARRSLRCPTAVRSMTQPLGTH